MPLYAHYDQAHRNPVNRALHAVAIPLGFSSIYFFARKRTLLGLSAIPVALGLASLGHLIEGNRPAFLSNPVHVLVAPLWLAKRILSGRTDQKAKQAVA